MLTPFRDDIITWAEKAKGFVILREMVAGTGARIAQTTDVRVAPV